MKVVLPVLRQVHPSVIAADLCGVQPMTGPTSQIFTMRIRWNEIPGCHRGCDFAFGEHFMHFVDIDVSRDDFDFSEIMGWSIKNIRGAFNYNREWPQWRWSFAEESDAMLFKMRWG